jgi:chromosome condensin MukBEF MukE localization factor
MKQVSKASEIKRLLKQGLKAKVVAEQTGTKIGYVYTISSNLRKQKKLTGVNKVKADTVKATPQHNAQTKLIHDLTANNDYLRRIYADARAVIQYLESKLTQLVNAK